MSILYINYTLNFVFIAVEVNITVIKSGNLKVHCLGTKYESTLTVEIRVNKHMMNTVTCSRKRLEQMVYLEHLDCTEQYNLSAVWVSNNTSFYEECLLFEKNAVSFNCAGSYTFTYYI